MDPIRVRRRHAPWRGQALAASNVLRCTAGCPSACGTGAPADLEPRRGLQTRGGDRARRRQPAPCGVAQCVLTGRLLRSHRSFGCGSRFCAPPRWLQHRAPSTSITPSRPQTTNLRRNFPCKFRPALQRRPRRTKRPLPRRAAGTARLAATGTGTGPGQAEGRRGPGGGTAGVWNREAGEEAAEKGELPLAHALSIRLARRGLHVDREASALHGVDLAQRVVHEDGLVLAQAALPEQPLHEPSF
mmetsp:Transcript_42169/g.112728  ORF Transcript_42169/g.112728 Transcript_42169/m.112728 type:complete len:244 (+) Transcript_42169:578-1309(+)